MHIIETLAGTWTEDEMAKLQGLADFICEVLGYMDEEFSPHMQDAIWEIPVLPIAKGVFLHVRGDWTVRKVGEALANDPSWETDLQAPSEQGVYDLDHEGWTRLKALSMIGPDRLIFMEKSLTEAELIASWVHELTHCTFDEPTANEAEKEYRANFVEREFLEYVLKAGIYDDIPALNEQLQRATRMQDYWAKALGF